MKTIIYDLETTGLRTKKDKIIEIYLYNIDEETFLHLLINPDCKISPKTTKIHGLTNMDLENKPIFKDVVPQILDFCGEKAYLISHNNFGFDKRFLLSEIKRSGFKPSKKWKYIDTLSIARHVLPNLKNHKQDTLRNYFGLSFNNSHRANKDVKDLSLILKKLTNDMSIEDIYKLSNSFYDKMPFGKYKGISLIKVPKDYVKWLITSCQDKLLLKSFEKAGILKKNKLN